MCVICNIPVLPKFCLINEERIVILQIVFPIVRRNSYTHFKMILVDQTSENETFRVLCRGKNKTKETNYARQLCTLYVIYDFYYFSNNNKKSLVLNIIKICILNFHILNYLEHL